MLTVGIIFVAPTMQMPALTTFVNGGGSVIGGSVLLYIYCNRLWGYLWVSYYYRKWNNSKNDWE